MDNWITEFMGDFGYIGIFLLIACENIFPPIPSEVILTFGGFMTTYTALTVPGVIVFATLGSVIGALVLYTIGAWFDEQKVGRFANRYGRFLRIDAGDVHKAYAWFHKFGPWAVFFCRLVPLLRSLISIPAGSIRMNLVTFLLLTTLGSLLWNTILICSGAAIGASWETILTYMSVYSNIAYALLSLLAVLFLVWFVRKKAGKRR